MKKTLLKIAAVSMVVAIVAIVMLFAISRNTSGEAEPDIEQELRTFMWDCGDYGCPKLKLDIQLVPYEDEEYDDDIKLFKGEIYDLTAYIIDDADRTSYLALSYKGKILDMVRGYVNQKYYRDSWDDMITAIAEESFNEEYFLKNFIVTEIDYLDWET